MLQKIILGIILLATAFFAVRWLLRTIKGKNGGCGCGCNKCPYNCEKRR